MIGSVMAEFPIRQQEISVASDAFVASGVQALRSGRLAERFPRVV